MKKVITYGTYDLLHFGHIRLLERAKELGDYLIVGVTADDFDKTRGKINVQQSLMERVEAVRATGIADEIIIEEYEGQKIDDIRKYNIDIFTVGSDWIGKFDYLNEYCKVVYLERTVGISSSELRADKRKLKLGVYGKKAFCRKFIKEIEYVNGVQYEECDEDFNNVDAVYIATNPQNHYEDVFRALRAKKHVICESPLAITSSQCEELLQYASQNNLILVDAIKTAYSTAFSRMLVIAKSGNIGDIVSVDSVCTSLMDGAGETDSDLSDKQNSICGWGPTALLPIFQLLGTNYASVDITTRIIDRELVFDAFTKMDFRYSSAVASAKVAKAAKSEGELIITGTKGYIYIPAPWWKTDYFEVRFENQTDNKRYFYQLDGEGIRYEIVAFAKSIETGKKGFFIEDEVSVAISKVIERYYNHCVHEI